MITLTSKQTYDASQVTIEEAKAINAKSVAEENLSSDCVLCWCCKKACCQHGKYSCQWIEEMVPIEGWNIDSKTGLIKGCPTYEFDYSHAQETIDLYPIVKSWCSTQRGPISLRHYQRNPELWIAQYNKMFERFPELQISSMLDAEDEEEEEYEDED